MYPMDDRVDVVHLGGASSLRAAGVRRGRVVAFRWGIRTGARALAQRSYLLLDDGVLIARPDQMPTGHEGWWWCDLVDVDERADRVVVADAQVDVLVGPPDRPYHVVDLDELADAVATGAVSSRLVADRLTRLQRFLDARLHTATPGTWRDFPPAAVSELEGRDDLPDDWVWFDADCGGGAIG
jgi:hypothetical protein